jgi:molecular chaperone GrpE (heat shock protein)
VKDAQRLELQHCRLRRVSGEFQEIRRKRKRWRCDYLEASAADQAEELNCVFSSIQTALLLAEENKQEARQKASVRKGEEITLSTFH